MSHPNLARALAVVAVSALAACSSGQQVAQLPVPAALTDSSSTSDTNVAFKTRHTQQLRAFAAGCTADVVILGIGFCTSIEVANSTIYGPTTPAALVPGYHPADLRSAYNLPASGGAGQTIGIVIPAADPNAEADLAVYRSTFGLPACTSANGCFHVLTAAVAPAANKDWAREASSDLDMVSATCPQCKVIFYEAASTAPSDLAAAVSAVIAGGATVVSNSYTVTEDSTESNAMWSHPGVPIVAAAGDNLYGVVNWPAASTNVIAVGATTLTRSATARGWTESVWWGTSSACGTIAVKPAWQKDTACSKRMIADVAAVGDPTTPVAAYDSYQDNGWIEVGGTSVATPIVAGIYGLAGNGASLTGAQSLYANSSKLFPVTSGLNGICSVAYLCEALASGYNGPTGMGTPNGIAAF